MIYSNSKKTIVNKGKKPKVPKGTNKELKSLMKDCWKTEPEKRPEFKTIYERLTLMKEISPKKKQ